MIALISTLFHVVSNTNSLALSVLDRIAEIISTCIEESLEITEDLVYALIINITKPKEKANAHKLCYKILKKCQDLLSTPVNE